MDAFALLRTVTLVYVAVLVLALAGSLFTIWAYLWRVKEALADVRQTLIEVEKQTAPLARYLAGGASGASRPAEKFEQATVAIEKAMGVVSPAARLQAEASTL
jgi:hypothetical protein